MATVGFTAPAPRMCVAAFADYTAHSPILPTLAEQLDGLDAARDRGDLPGYAKAWLAHSDENGAAAYVHWRRDGEGSWGVILSFDMNALTGNGRMRHEALNEHAEGVEGFREALIDHLIAVGRILDNRVPA